MDGVQHHDELLFDGFNVKGHSALCICPVAQRSKGFETCTYMMWTLTVKWVLHAMQTLCWWGQISRHGLSIVLKCTKWMSSSQLGVLLYTITCFGNWSHWTYGHVVCFSQ
eukprot:782202-Amphidinium_carterae.1